MDKLSMPRASEGPYINDCVCTKSIFHTFL